ncbi:YfhO family protein [Streptococcus ovuberis]|uniref:YfhO family protein n=1 Tax=Streptococcus ovuberis TaxID=1936207 RepID=A0A7X6MX45_9STRE|nr:YfhO family protein [Streptococcus ovuberis]
MLPIVVMTATFWKVGLYPFGEKTLMSGDYTFQYIPLYRALGHLFKSGDIGALYWSWHKGLGGVMSPVWGFNSLSPLSLIIGLVPARYLNLAIFGITLLRNALASLTFYYFLHKRYQVDQHRLLGLAISVSYGLNGFFLANQVNPNFLDNLILLPLLLVGVEKILDGQKSFKYVLVLASMFVIQFYTAFMASVFVVFYAIFYTFAKSQKIQRSLQQIVRLALYSLLGLALSSVWLLPVFYALLETKVAGATPVPWNVQFVYQPLKLFLKFFPGAVSGEEWGDSHSLPNIYIGLLGLVGLSQFFFAKHLPSRQKMWTAGVLITLVLAFSNYAPIRFWHMLQMPVGFYYRNAFVLSFFFLLLAYLALRSVHSWTYLELIGTGTVLTIAISVAIGTRSSWKYPLVTNEQLFFSVVLLILILGCLLTPKGRSLGVVLILGLTLLDLGVNAGISTARTLWLIPKNILENEAKVEKNYRQLAIDQTGLTRLEKSELGTWNDSLVYNYYGVNHFTSSVEYATLEFLGKLGLQSSTAISVYTGGTPLTDALLNLNQFIETGHWEINTRKFNPVYFQEVKKVNQWILFKNPNYLGLGYSGSAKLMKFQLKDENPIENQNTLYTGIFGDERPIIEPITAGYLSLTLDNMDVDPAYGGRMMKRLSPDKPAVIRMSFTPQDNRSYYLYAPHIKNYDMGTFTASLNGENYKMFDRFRHPQIWGIASAAKGETQRIEFTLDNDDPIDLADLGVYSFDDERFQTAVASSTVSKWRPVEVSSTRLAGPVTQVEGNDYLYTSIPYNKGWKVKVDGQLVKAEKAFGAMLAFKLKPGVHQLSITYSPPGFKLGLFLTSASVLMILLWQYQKEILGKAQHWLASRENV